MPHVMQADRLVVEHSTLGKHQYPSMSAFLKAVKRGEVPDDLVSPGWVVDRVGITRQAVHHAINAGKLESWYVEGGYVFVRPVDVVKRWG